MAITFLDEEEDIVAAAEPPKGASRITFLDEEEPEAPALGGFSIPAAPERPVFQEEPEASSDWDLLRGGEVALRQVPQLAYGVAGLVGATSEQITGYGEALRDFGFRGYKEWEESMEPISKDTDDITVAWDRAKQGDVGALVDWAQYGVGYALGQLGETAAVAVLGGLAGAAAGAPAGGVGAVPAAAGGAIAAAATKQGFKTLARDLVEKAIASQATKIVTREAERKGVKLTAEQVAKEASQEAIKRQAGKEIGSNIGIFGNAIGMQLGSIYGEAESKAQAEGRDLTGYDLARVWGTGLATGGVEGVVDKLGLDLLKGKLSGALPEGRLAGAAVAGGVGVLGEAATEGVQTVGERFGAGKDILGDEALNEYINAAALGGLGGGVIGGAGGFVSGNPKENAAAKAKVAAEASKNIAPESSKLVADQADAVINEVAQETPDEKVARLQREAQEAAGIELEEESSVSGLPPVSELPPVKEGFVRLYHGGASATAGEFTPYLDTALGYAQQSKGSIFYVDVPEDSEFLRRGDYDEQGNISERGMLAARQSRVPNDIAQTAQRAASGFEAQPVTPTAEAPVTPAVAPVEPVVPVEGAVEPAVTEVAPETVPEEQKFNNLRESIGATNRLVGDMFQDKIVYSTSTQEGQPEAELVVQENEEIPNRVTLETIFTPPEFRGRGLANQKMQSFLQNVDRLGMDVQLSVDPESASRGVEGDRMTSEQLKDWYRKYGFFFPEDSDNGFRASEATKNRLRANTITYDPAVHKIPKDENFYSDRDTLFNVFRENPERFQEGGIYAVNNDSVYVLKDNKLVGIRDVVFQYDYETNQNIIKPQATIISPEAKFETAAPEAAPAAVEPTPVTPTPVTPEVPTAEQGAGAFNEFIREELQRQVDEQRGQQVLDAMEQAGESPRAVVEDFYRNIYDNLSPDVRARFDKYVERLGWSVPATMDASPKSVGMEGAVDLGNDVQALEGIERGFVALAKTANDLYTRGPEVTPTPELVAPTPEVREARPVAAKPRKLKEPATMTAGEVNKEMDRLRAESSQITQEFIDAGRGEERPSEYLKKTDPLSVRAKENADRMQAVRDEIRLRYGTDVSTLPTGRRFGPRARPEPATPPPTTNEGEKKAKEILNEQVKEASKVVSPVVPIKTTTPPVTTTPQAQLLPSDQADRADAVLAVSKRNNYYTLWFVRQFVDGKPVKNSFQYLTILSTDPDEAVRKANAYGSDIIGGKSLSIAFAGKNLQNLQGAKTISILPEFVEWDQLSSPLRGAAAGPIGQQTVGFGKYAGVKVDDLYAKDSNYVDWLMSTNPSSKRVRDIVDYLRTSSPELQLMADARELEGARIRAYEERESRRRGGEQVPVTTLVRREGQIVEEAVEQVAPKPKAPKLTDRKAKDQMVDIIAPRTNLPDRVASNLKPQMYPIQVDGANAVIDSMDRFNVALNGDGAGVGKTRQIIAVADHYAKQGKPVVIVTENAAIGKPWEGRKTPILGGSMAKDSEAMGVTLNLLTETDKPADSGAISITTYNRVTTQNIPTGAIVIFDESQNLANTFGAMPDERAGTELGQWQIKFRDIFGQAERTAFYSATPADKPHQLAYLYKVLGFNSPEEYLSNAVQNGTVIKTRRFGSIEQKYYDVPSGKNRKAALYKWVNGIMTDAGNTGRFIKREISYEGTDVQFHDVKGTDQEKNPWAKPFLDALAQMASFQAQGYLLLAPNSYVLYGAELTKIGDAVRIAKRELDAGRKIVIYFSRINDLKIRGRMSTMGMDGRMELGEPVDLGTIPSPVVLLRDELKKEGIKFTELHGKSGTTSQKAQKEFAGPTNVLLASVESGGTGINLDDTTGNEPRTEIFMFSPYRGISTIQAMGRIWRASTIQNDNKPNRFVFATASDIDADASRSAVLAKKLQLMNASLGGTAVSRLPMSKTSYDPSQLVGIELPEEGVESAALAERTGVLMPVSIKWSPTRKGGFYAKATADLLEWIERGGADRTGINVSVFKSRDSGEWVALADKEYKPEDFVEKTKPVTPLPPSASTRESRREPTARRVQMGRAGMEPSAVEARLQELGFPTGGIIRVVNEPDADFEGRTIILDGKVTGIELNASAMRDNATIDRVLNHEFAESANADGALNRLVERLTPKEKKEINDTITRLRYEERARTAEEAARAIETLAEAWKGRGFFTRAVARVEAWASKLGFKLTRRAAEYIAARNLADINAGFRTAYNRFINVKGEAREGRAFVTPEENARFLELAKDPEANREELQKMVDDAAKKAGYYPKKLYHGTPDGRFYEFDVSSLRGVHELSVGTRPVFLTTSENVADEFRGGIWVMRSGMNDKYVIGKDEGEIVKAYPKHSEVKALYAKFDNLDIYDFFGGAYNEETVTNLLKSAKKSKKGGVVFRSMADGSYTTTGRLPVSNIVAIFDPKNIKSADPVTYDSQGNVIPLEQRFQPATPDIRYARREVRESRREPEAIPTFTEGTPEAATLKEMATSMAKVDAASEAKGGKPETYKISEIASVWMDSGLGERELQDAIVEYTNLTPANAAKVAKAINKQYGIQQQLVEAAAPLAEIAPEPEGAPRKSAVTKLIEQTTGVRKPVVKLQVSESAALKKQIQLKAREARETRKARKEAAEDLAKAITDYVKANPIRGPINSRQAMSITKKALKLDVNNEAAVDRFEMYVERVIENANYDRDLADARALIKRAKAFAKAKDTQGNVKTTLEAIANISPTLLDNPFEFNLVVQRYLLGLAPVTAKQYSVMPDADVRRYLESLETQIKDNQEILDRAKAQRILDKQAAYANEKGIPLDEAIAILNSEEFLEEKTIEKLEDLTKLLTSMAQESQKDVKAYDDSGATPKQKELISFMRKVNLDSLLNEQKKQYIRSANNLLANGATFGMEQFQSIALGQESVVKALKDKRLSNKLAAWISPIGGDKAIDTARRLAAKTQSEADTFKNIFGREAVGVFRNILGLNRLDVAQTDSNRAKEQIANEFGEYFKGLRKKYGNDATGFEAKGYAGIAGYLIQTDGNKTEAESIPYRRRLMEQNIVELRKSDKQADLAEADLKERALAQLTGTTNAEILSQLKALNPASYEQLMWVKDTMLPKWRDFLKEHDENFRNQANNYNNPDHLTITYKFPEGQLLPSEMEDVYQQDMVGMRIKQAANSIKRKDHPNLPVSKSGTIANIDINFGYNQYNALVDQVDKAYVAPAWEQVVAFSKDPNFEQVVGGRANALFVKNLLRDIQTSRSRQSITDDEAQMIAGGVRLARKISTQAVLGGFTQPLRQVPDQLSKLFFTTGRWDLITKNLLKTAEAAPLLNKFPIGRRGDAQAGTQYASQFSELARKVEASVTDRKWAQYRELMNRVGEFWMAPLRGSDVWAAKVSWMSYYESELNKKGIKMESWEREAELIDTDQNRKEAASYAEFAVDFYGGASDPTKMASLSKQTNNGWKEFAKLMFLPLNSFALQQKNSLISDLRDAYLRTGDRKASIAAISGTLAGMAAFHGMRIYIIGGLVYPAGKALLMGVFGIDMDEPDEEEKQKKLEDDWRKFKASMYGNIVAGGAGEFVEKAAIDAVNKATYLIQANVNPDELLNDKGEVMSFRQYEKDMSPLYRFRSFGTSEYSFGLADVLTEQAQRALAETQQIMTPEEMEKYSGNEQAYAMFSTMVEWLYFFRLMDTDATRIARDLKRQMDKGVEEREAEIRAIQSGR